MAVCFCECHAHSLMHSQKQEKAPSEKGWDCSLLRYTRSNIRFSLTLLLVALSQSLPPVLVRHLGAHAHLTCTYSRAHAQKRNHLRRACFAAESAHQALLSHFCF